MIPDKDLTDDVLDEIIAGAKTSMEQHLALSLKAERKVWRQEGPTDDERIMAIEGMIGCLRCGDNGWVVGEMGITRCACGQAGNSPVIPDGYVMVPMRLTAENGAKGALSGEFSETKFVNCPECFGDVECETCDGSGRIEITVPVTWTTIKEIWAKGVKHFAAAPQPQNEPQNIPEIIPQWIPVSERLPEDDDFVYIWPRPDFGVDLHVGQYCECSPKGEGWYAQIYEQNYGVDWHPITVTHWMPLPAAPQEVKGE